MPLLEISAPQDTEISVLDSSLQPVGRAVGKFIRDLPTGYYKINAQLGGHVTTKLISLQRDQEVPLDLTVSSPFTPATGMDLAVLETKLASAEPKTGWKFSRLSNSTESENSRLLICFGPHDGNNAPDWFSGATIMRWRGVAKAQELIKQMKRITVGRQCWWIVRYAVPAGTYVLECDHDERRRRQVVPALENYESRIFATPGNHNMARDLTFFVDTNRPNEPTWREPELSNPEIVQNALWHDRKIFIHKEAIRAYLDEKFDDPVLGLSAAFLMISALQDVGKVNENTSSYRQSRKHLKVEFNPNLIGVVFRNLVRLFTGKIRAPNDSDDGFELPPDLVALGLIAEPFANERLIAKEQYKIMTPPLYFRSWEILKAHAAHDGRVWINRGLWSELAKSAAIGPYFAWHPARISVTELVERELAGRERNRTLENIAEQLSNIEINVETYADFLRKYAPETLKALNEKRQRHKLPVIESELTVKTREAAEFDDIFEQAESAFKAIKNDARELSADQLVELSESLGLPKSVTSTFSGMVKLGKTLKSGY